MMGVGRGEWAHPLLFGKPEPPRGYLGSLVPQPPSALCPGAYLLSA